MNLSFFARPPRKKLGCLDAFYKMTVSQLCREARRQYCVNLIGRLEEDLKKSNCRHEIRQIREHIQAARSEIKNLSRQPSS